MCDLHDWQFSIIEMSLNKTLKELKSSIKSVENEALIVMIELILRDMNNNKLGLNKKD